MVLESVLSLACMPSSLSLRGCLCVRPRRRRCSIWVSAGLPAYSGVVLSVWHFLFVVRYYSLACLIQFSLCPSQTCPTQPLSPRTLYVASLPPFSRMLRRGGGKGSARKGDEREEAKRCKSKQPNPAVVAVVFCQFQNTQPALQAEVAVLRLGLCLFVVSMTTLRMEGKKQGIQPRLASPQLCLPAAYVCSLSDRIWLNLF
jgi:hypothetical protein